MRKALSFELESPKGYTAEEKVIQKYEINILTLIGTEAQIWTILIPVTGLRW